MTTKPDLLIIGQVTVDDVVPPTPGPWRRQMGGSSLYAAAGARLWLEPARIGLVARVGTDYPFDAESLLCGAGLQHIALRPIPEEHLVEWLIYEPDGSRRSLPRNVRMLEIGAEGASAMPAATQAYQDKLLAIAPAAADVPAEWLPAAALHLCTQVGDRHEQTIRALQGRVGWISVDPSPYYSRQASTEELSRRLRGATAFLPSANEVRRLLGDAGPEQAVLALQRAGFAEVALKRGAEAVLLAYRGDVAAVPAAMVSVVDPTGAGDAFCGAYAACRLQGLTPVEAVQRAAATAALVVGCSGVEAALRLVTPAMAGY
jgi:sugar/nucleoside kinase (ribokinase family)